MPLYTEAGKGNTRSSEARLYFPCPNKLCVEKFPVDFVHNWAYIEYMYSGVAQNTCCFVRMNMM